MKTTASQYAQALYAISQEKPSVEYAKIVKDFLSFLRRRGDFKKLSGIVKKLEALRDNQDGVQRVVVTSVFPLSLALEETMEAFAQTIFESKKVILDIQIDKRLLGGVVMNTENYLLDASLSKKVQSLRKVLLQ